MSLRSIILIRNFRFTVISVMRHCHCGRLPLSCRHHLTPIGGRGRHHSCCLPRRHLPQFFKIASATTVTACRDIIAVIRHPYQSHHPRRFVEGHLPAPSFHQGIGLGEMFSDCLKTALARSVDLSDSAEATSPRIRLTSHFGPSRGRCLARLLRSSSYPQNITSG